MITKLQSTDPERLGKKGGLGSGRNGIQIFLGRGNRVDFLGGLRICGDWEGVIRLG